MKLACFEVDAALTMNINPNRNTISFDGSYTGSFSRDSRVFGSGIIPLTGYASRWGALRNSDILSNGTTALINMDSSNHMLESIFDIHTNSLLSPEHDLVFRISTARIDDVNITHQIDQCVLTIFLVSESSDLEATIIGRGEEITYSLEGVNEEIFESFLTLSNFPSFESESGFAPIQVMIVPEPSCAFLLGFGLFSFSIRRNRTH